MVAAPFALIAIPIAAHAQVGPMPLRGTHATPTAHGDVSMRALSAELVFEPESETFAVQARYELSNAAAREVRVQLGMPEPRCESDDEDAAACADPHAFRFESPAIRVRGQPVPMRKATLPSQHEWAPVLAGVWAFEVRLRGNEVAPVEHAYRAPAGPAAGGGRSATLATRAAQLWAEPIDRATLTFVIPVRSCLVVEPEHIQRKSRRVVLRDGEPWLSLTYAARRWTPRADLSLYFDTCIPPRDTELPGCSLLEPLAHFAYGPAAEGEGAPVERKELEVQLGKLSEAELKQCGDAPFAAYGSYYTAEELLVLADRPSASRHYTAPLLTPADWKWVSLVDDVIAARKSKPAAPRVPAADSGSCDVASSPGAAGDRPRTLTLTLAVLVFVLRSRSLRARLRAAGNRSESRRARARAGARSRPRARAAG